MISRQFDNGNMIYRHLSFLFVVVLMVTVVFENANSQDRSSEVKTIFQSGDQGKKLEWIWKIPKIDQEFPKYARELVKLGMEDRDVIIRQNTILAIEATKNKRYLSHLERIMNDEEESVRWFVGYAAKAMRGEDTVDDPGKNTGKGVLECKYDGMIGYYGPITPGDEWGWKFMDEFRRLGFGYSFGDPGSLTKLWCPDKPSWRGGKTKPTASFWNAMKKYEERGIDFYFVFGFKSKSGYETVTGKELGHQVDPAGWQLHFYEKGLDREIRESWDNSAPPGWTLLDEFKLHVRNIMTANKQHGDMIDGWLFFSEPSRSHFFGNNYENVGLLISIGMEVAREISPEAFLGFHGILRPRLDRLRNLYAHGATDMYAAAFRRYLNNMPESNHLEDDIANGGGWLETFNSFYSQAKKWGIVDPRDGRTKVVEMERFLNVIGEERGPTFGPMTFIADTPYQRDKHADYWARSVLLALSTGFVSNLSAVYHNNPFWSWGSPSGIGIQYDIAQVQQLRRSDIANAFSRGNVPPKPKNMSNRSAVMKWTFYQIFKKRGREGLYKVIDGYLAERRPDKRKPSYFASLILNNLLGHATFISRLKLEEPNFGFRFRDDESGRMITALWRASKDDGEVKVTTEDSTLRIFEREGNLGIREYTVAPTEGKVILKVGSNPVYLVGELKEMEWTHINLLNKSRQMEAEERGIIEIFYQAGRDVSGGALEVDLPNGWIRPQVISSSEEGFVTVEPGPGIEVGGVFVDGMTIRIPIKNMRNGHTLRIIYGDARKESYLYDMGEDQFGPISTDHLKMQGNMTYYQTAGDGFDHEGLPRSRDKFRAQWPSSGGCGIPDNDPHSVHRDMAMSATFKGWKFSVDVEPENRYQVKIFLNGKGEIDDQLSSQRVVIGGDSFDSTRDRVVQGVSPDSNGRITVRFSPDKDGNSMERYFRGDPREKVIYGGRRIIPDNTKICYLYGLELMPEHLGGGPTGDAAVGPNRFQLRARASDGTVTLIETDMEVTPKISR